MFQPLWDIKKYDDFTMLLRNLNYIDKDIIFVCVKTHTHTKPTKITMNLGSWNIFPGVQPGLRNSIWNDGGNDHSSKEKNIFRYSDTVDIINSLNIHLCILTMKDV